MHVAVIRSGHTPAGSLIIRRGRPPAGAKLRPYGTVLEQDVASDRLIGVLVYDFVGIRGIEYLIGDKAGILVQRYAAAVVSEGGRYPSGVHAVVCTVVSILV